MSLLQPQIRSIRLFKGKQKTDDKVPCGSGRPFKIRQSFLPAYIPIKETVKLQELFRYTLQPLSMRVSSDKMRLPEFPHPCSNIALVRSYSTWKICSSIIVPSLRQGLEPKHWQTLLFKGAKKTRQTMFLHYWMRDIK